MPAGSGPPTMRDVARNAGVSLKTVSRVVNGETTVAPDLAARVRAAVEALNYRPNIGASLLRRSDRRSRTIGVLLTDMSEPFSAAVHRAIEDEARARGVHVLTASLDDDPRRERDLTHAFAQRQADGLVLTPAGPDQRHLGSLGKLPIVLVERPAEGYAGDRAVASNIEGAVSAIRHLVGYGHRRIAFLGDRSGGWIARERYRGYRQAMTEAGTATAAGVFDAADLTDLLSGPDPPTALFCERESVTVGVLRALRPLGLRNRIAVIGFGDLQLADLLDPPLTVVAVDAAAMGRAAARALFERIDGLTVPAREIRIPTTLIPRGSGELVPPP